MAGRENPKAKSFRRSKMLHVEGNHHVRLSIDCRLKGQFVIGIFQRRTVGEIGWCPMRRYQQRIDQRGQIVVCPVFQPVFWTMDYLLVLAYKGISQYTFKELIPRTGGVNE